MTGDIDVIHRIAALAGFEPWMLDREIVQLIKNINLQYPNSSYNFQAMELKAKISPITACAMKRRTKE